MRYARAQQERNVSEITCFGVVGKLHILYGIFRVRCKPFEGHCDGYFKSFLNFGNCQCREFLIKNFDYLVMQFHDFSILKD